MTCIANQNLKPSPLCFSVIKSSEECKLKAYLCPAKIWTIGYGHTNNVKENDTCTQGQANAWLIADVAYAERVVKNAVNVPLSQGKYDALVSFVFNVGPGAKGVKSGFVTLVSGAPSSMLRLLNANDYAGAADEFDKWTKGGGAVLGGLVKRRRMEKTLFLEA